MIILDEMGGRTIKLFIPFEFNGKKITSITVGPLKFGHSLRWAAGDWKEAIDFLVELAGVEDAVIRELRFPDADRVMESFLAILPADIRDDIANGRIPVKKTEDQMAELQQAIEEAKAAKANGGGAQDVPLEHLQGPGVPLPEGETGFDLSDEQP
jgi:hypothetical protein